MSSGELAAVVQEVVDRPGWTSGASMVFQITADEGSNPCTSFDADPSAAPRLRVRYEAPGM